MTESPVGHVPQGVINESVEILNQQGRPDLAVAVGDLMAERDRLQEQVDAAMRDECNGWGTGGADSPASGGET